jgi:hypothetical protein
VCDLLAAGAGVVTRDGHDGPATRSRANVSHVSDRVPVTGYWWEPCTACGRNKFGPGRCRECEAAAQP